MAWARPALPREEVPGWSVDNRFRRGYPQDPMYRITVLIHEPKVPADVAQGYRFGVLCVVPADADPRVYAGVGGQAAVQRGLYVTFIVAAYIRELGIRATAKPEPEADRLAAAAGLGKLNQAGRLVAPKRGARVYVADMIRTDLPLAADG